MKHGKFFVLIGLTLAIGTLVVYQATRTSASLVAKPSDLASSTDTTLSRVRVAGRVTQDQIEYQLEPSIRLSFSISDPPPKTGDTKTGDKPLSEPPSATTPVGVIPVSVIPVVYEGIKPDMFAAGRDVLIDGEFKGGVLYAHKLLTQCPSKYEPPSPDGSTARK